MAIARELAGYTLGGADLLRRAMGKKKPEVLAAEFGKFQSGMRANSYSDESIQALWDTMLPFAGYAFNKSHAAAYGLVSYQTAYLKANYPAEFMAALLTSVGDDKDKMAVYLADARGSGIKVLSPDINESVADFTAVGDNVRFGLRAVRNVGLPVIDSLVATRREKGKFTTFADFLTKVELPVCNKRAMDSLIKAGAFDSLDHTRRALSGVYETAIDAVTGVKRQQAIGQDDLFGALGSADDGPVVGLDFELSDQEWPRKHKLTLERQMLGLYVSGHPLDGTEHILSRNRETTITELLASGRTEGEVQLAGLITSVDRRINKKGDPWAMLTVSDRDGEIEVLFFAKSYILLSAEQLAEDNVVSVRGRLNERDGALSMFGSELTVLDVSTAEFGNRPPVLITLPSSKVRGPMVAELKRALTAHPGDAPVRLTVIGTTHTTVYELPDYRVDPTIAFASEIKALLGSGALV